jgi:hypothetical protein
VSEYISSAALFLYLDKLHSNNEEKQYDARDIHRGFEKISQKINRLLMIYTNTITNNIANGIVITINEKLFN